MSSMTVPTAPVAPTTASDGSFFTFLVYLNDDFEGGETEFEDIATVQPKTGDALVFYHPYRHEGKTLLSGKKYVLRTDIMFEKEILNLYGQGLPIKKICSKLNIGKSDIEVSGEMKSSIYKSQLNYVDSEAYTVYVHDNRMVLFSDQSETSTAVGLIER